MIDLKLGDLEISFGVDPIAVETRQVMQVRQATVINPTAARVDAVETEAKYLDKEEIHEEKMAHLMAENPVEYEKMLAKEIGDHKISDEHKEPVTDAEDESGQSE